MCSFTWEIRLHFVGAGFVAGQGQNGRSVQDDRVSHGYDAIDYATLWDTVRADVPGLLVTVEQMLKDLEASEKA